MRCFNFEALGDHFRIKFFTVIDGNYSKVSDILDESAINKYQVKINP